MFLNSDILDNGLQEIVDRCSHVYVCSAYPTTYAEASSTYALGVKATPTVGAPAARTGGGRQVTLAAFTDGTVSTAGTGAYLALVDSATSERLAVIRPKAPIALTIAGGFAVSDGIIIGFPGYEDAA